MQISKRSFIILILSIITISSCTPVRKLKYLQREKNNLSDTIIAQNKPYILQKGDNLFIDIKTSNPEMRSLVNGKIIEPNTSTTTNSATLYISSYVIDENWNIQLPLVGSYNCKDMTCEILKDSIEFSLKKFITDAVVSVKLVNTNITVLGEVMRPGQYFANQKQINLLDAIGMAGDLTVYGNRKNITVMRKMQNGDFKMYYMDITKSNIVSHEAFYLMPNDIIYIEPLKTKPFGLAVFPYSTVLSSITTVIVIMSFILKK